MSTKVRQIDPRKKLADLAARVAQLKSEKSRIEGQLQTLEEQRESIFKSCSDMGVDPEKLDEEISLREKSLHNTLQDLERRVSDIECCRDEVVERERDSERASDDS